MIYLIAGTQIIIIVFLFVNHLKQNKISMTQKDALNRLTASCDHLTTVVESQTALLGTIAGQIRDNVDDSEALGALADALDKETEKVTAAIAANTPAAPAVGA